MQITVQLPDDLAQHPNAAREVLEAFAIEGYRSRQLSESEVRRLLQLETRMEVHALLVEHDVALNYTEDHLRQDIQASDRLHSQRMAGSAKAA